MDNITTEILNDLIQVNNDRIAGYGHALTQLEKGYDNLENLFRKMIEESEANNKQLTVQLHAMNAEVADGTSGAGKLRRTWMDVKALLTDGNPGPILTTCEALEDAALRAYEDALNEEDLAAGLRTLITNQKEILVISHENIKKLLDITSS